MKLIYNVDDKPKFGQLIIFAIQQLLAIMTATLVVPVIIGNGMDPAAALFGAGVGTIVYQLTKNLTEAEIKEAGFDSCGVTSPWNFGFPVSRKLM